MIYSMGRRGANEGGQGCTPSITFHLPTAVGRIVDAGAYLLKIWLRPALRGQHLKGPMEPNLYGTWLACQQGDRSFAKWTAIFGHCERSFIFLAKFAKKSRSRVYGPEKKAKVRNVLNFGYFGASNTPYDYDHSSPFYNFYE